VTKHKANQTKTSVGLKKLSFFFIKKHANGKKLVAGMAEIITQHMSEQGGGD